MPSKRKKVKRFSATKAVKAIARERIGSPPATRKEENPKKQDRPKHKPGLSELLDSGDRDL